MGLRLPRALVALVLPLALLLPSTLEAQEGPTRGWSLLGRGEPDPQSYEIGLRRGRGRFHARVTVAPILEFDPSGTVQVHVGGSQVSLETIERENPGGLAILTWEMDLSQTGYPYQAVTEVRAIFDTGTETAGGGSPRFTIPEDATMLDAVEVDMEWFEEIHTLRFVAETIPVTDLQITGIDPEHPLEEAIPVQLVRLAARTPETANEGRRDRFQLRVSNARTGQARAVMLEEWGEDSGFYVSQPLLLAAEGAEEDPVYQQIPVCPTDFIEVRAQSRMATLQVVAGDDRLSPVPCIPPPAPPVFRLRAQGQTRVTLEPRPGVETDPLRVVFTDEDGEPVAHEPVLWMAPDGARFDVVETITDSAGEARLDFAVDPRGALIWVVDGLPTGAPFGDGEWRIQAVPKNPLLGSLLDGGPPEFTVDFVRPTAMRMTRQNGAVKTVLMEDDQFFVQIWPGRRDEARLAGAEEVEVTITSSTDDEITVDAVRGASGIYETAVRTLAVESGAPLVTGEIESSNGGTITASWGGTSTSLPFYTSNLRRADAETRALLEFYGDAIRQALRSSDLLAEERGDLQLRLQLVRNAEQWLDEPHPTGLHRVSVTRAYLELLTDEADDALGEAVSRPAGGVSGVPGSLRDTDITFVTSAEANRVAAALSGASSASLRAWLELPSDISDRVVNFVYSLRELPTSWAIGGYTAITGFTADGQVATGLERVLGGVEAVATLAGGVGAGARLASFGRAARSMGVRAAVADAAASRFSFAAVAGTGDGAAAGALARTVSAEIAEEAGDAARLARMADAPDAPAGTRTLERLRRSLDRSTHYYNRWSEELGDASTTAQRLEDDLRQLRAHRADARAAGRGTITVRRRIAQKIRAIRRVRRRIERLENSLEHHRGIRDRAGRALSRRLGESLTDEQLAQLRRDRRLPHARDRIDGVLAQNHYEAQVNRYLRDQGFEPGEGVTLRTAYPSPLGEGFGARPTATRTRGVTRAPEMDHVNPNTLDVADSKYYDFTRAAAGDAEAAAKAALEITDTVEKGRVVQMNLIRRRMAGDGGDAIVWEDAVFREAAQKNITIYTPTRVPDNVRDIIQRLVGPNTWRGVRFEVLEPDIPSWRTGR